MFDVNPTSTNRKTAGCATIKSSSKTCPPCPWKKKGCLGDNFPMKFWWDTRCTLSVKEALIAVRRIKRTTITRLWEVGDFPGSKGIIDEDIAMKFAHVLQNKVSFGYTHYSPFKGDNQRILEKFNESCTMNLSANNIAQADKFLAKTSLPVVLTCHEDTPNKFLTPKGNLGIVCPHEQFTSSGKRKVEGCEPCGGGYPLCARADRGYIIVFRAHGGQKKMINEYTERDLIHQIPILK